MTLADLNGPDFVGLDAPPCQTLPPGSAFSAPLFVSHWSARAIERPVVRWAVTFTDRFGERREVTSGEQRIETLARYSVTETGVLQLTMPDEPGLATVQLWLCDQEEVRVRNYVNVDVWPGSQVQLPQHERWGASHVVRFSPAEFADSNWPNPRLGSGGAKFGAGGAGWVEYAVPLPAELDPASIGGLRLRVEAGARTARSRVGWHDARYEMATDYPQTESYKLQSEAVVSINGVPLGELLLPDDPADARGVLSAHNSSEWEFASFGFLYTLAADAARTRRIIELARDGTLNLRFEVPRSGVRGGINLYGGRLGAYPIDPMLIFETP